MDIDNLAKSIWAQFVTVWETPVPVIAAGIAIWFLLRWYFSGTYKTRLDNAKSTKELLERQLQEYRDKLSGASPDEAKARLDALEARLDGLSPRRLSSDQRNVLSAALDKFSGSPVDIYQDMGVPDARRLSQDIGAAFNAARWDVTTPSIMGLNSPPISGIAIKVSNSENLTEAQAAIVDAFKKAKLEFDLQTGEPRPTRPEGPLAVAAITVSNRQD